MQGTVAALDEGDHRFLRVGVHHGAGEAGRHRRFRSVPQTVDYREENPGWGFLDDALVAGFPLSGENPGRHTHFDPAHDHLPHFVTVTVVPRPTVDSMANSSISLRTPGNPRPRPPEVE